MIIFPTNKAVSFDWFQSGLEWILNFTFCLLKLLIFNKKLIWNIRSRLNSSTLWVFEPVFKYVWSKSSFRSTKISRYRPKNSKLNWTEINQNSQCEMCTVVMNECIWVRVINLNTSLMLLPAGMTLFRHVLMAFKASRPPPLRKLHLFAAKSLTPVSNFVCSLHERLRI